MRDAEQRRGEKIKKPDGRDEGDRERLMEGKLLSHAERKPVHHNSACDATFYMSEGNIVLSTPLHLFDSFSYFSDEDLTQWII